MPNNGTNMARDQIHSLFLLLKELSDKNQSIKNDVKVCFQEIRMFILLLKGINQNEIETTEKEAKDFYLFFLVFTERLVKFNNGDDLDYRSISESIRKILTSQVEFISISLIFKNSEPERNLFIELLEEISEEMTTQEYIVALREQNSPSYQGEKVLNWI